MTTSTLSQGSVSSLAGTVGQLIANADALRASRGRASGYVEVADHHFHVAQTIEGPLVSLVQWRNGEDGRLTAQHNLFSVTAEQQASAVQAWNQKMTERNQATEGLPTDSTASLEAAKPKTSGTGRMR